MNCFPLAPTFCLSNTRYSAVSPLELYSMDLDMKMMGKEDLDSNCIRIILFHLNLFSCKSS